MSGGGAVVKVTAVDPDIGAQALLSVNAEKMHVLSWLHQQC